MDSTVQKGTTVVNSSPNACTVVGGGGFALLLPLLLVSLIFCNIYAEDQAVPSASTRRSSTHNELSAVPLNLAQVYLTYDSLKSFVGPDSVLIASERYSGSLLDHPAIMVMNDTLYVSTFLQLSGDPRAVEDSLPHGIVCRLKDAPHGWKLGVRFPLASLPRVAMLPGVSVLEGIVPHAAFSPFDLLLSDQKKTVPGIR